MNFKDLLLTEKYHDHKGAFKMTESHRKVKPVPYTNRFNDIVRLNNFQAKQIAKDLNIAEGTISKHCNGHSPIGWDMAQMYAKYFMKEHALMIDAFTLLTGKLDKNDELCYNSLEPGKIPLLGNLLYKTKKVEFFEQGAERLFLTTNMFNHYVFSNAQNWGISALAFCETDLPPLNPTNDIFVTDYHYWLFLKSPIINNNVHAHALNNLSICQVSGSKDKYCGFVYERPRRNRQAPKRYEIVDPGILESGFLPPDVNLDSVELDWASPILSAIPNPHANGMFIEKEFEL